MTTDEENAQNKKKNPDELLLREALRAYDRREYPNLSQAAKAFGVSYPSLYYRYKNQVIQRPKLREQKDRKGKLKNREVSMLMRWIGGELQKTDFLRIWEVAGVVQAIIVNRRSGVNGFGKRLKRPEITEVWLKYLLRLFKSSLNIELSHGYIYRAGEGNVARKTQEFFDHVLAARTNYGILKQRIFCVSESELQLANLVSKISTSHGKDIQFDRSKRLTVIECTSASGKVLRPFIGRFTANNDEGETDLRIRDFHSSWDTDFLMLDWLENHFLPLTVPPGTTHTCILIIFGSERNVSREFRQICERNIIIPIFIPTQAWPYFLRIDFSASRSLNPYYASRLQAMSKPTETMSDALDEYLKARETIANSSATKLNFMGTGLMPLVPDKVLSQIPQQKDRLEQFEDSEGDQHEEVYVSSRTGEKRNEDDANRIGGRVLKSSTYGDSECTSSDSSSDDESWYD